MGSKIEGLRFEGDDEADSLDKYFEDPAEGTTSKCLRCGATVAWSGDGWARVTEGAYRIPTGDYFCPRNPARDGHEVLLEPASLPYAGTSGWSGSDASRERAEERDRSGKTGRLQQRVLWAVENCGGAGTTIKHIRDIFPDEHHGTLSGALTVLHKAGRLARLTEKRDRCSIYVAPEFVNGRETVEPKRSLDLFVDLRARADAAENNYEGLVESIKDFIDQHVPAHDGAIYGDLRGLRALLPDGDER